MWEMHDRMSENIDRASCAALIDSIQKHGQKHPVLARAPERPDDFEYELIYGARRLFAAQHLGIDLLVDVRELDNRTSLIEMDVENRVRADISPYERGRSYQRWLSAGYFKSQTDMAKALGVSDSQVSRLLRYAELPAVVVAAFGSPHDIREEWAVVLAKMCAEPKTRALLTQRARNLSNLPRQGSDQVVFDTLRNGRGIHGALPSRSRDEVMRDARGKPLYKVRFKTRAVHLILPRERVTIPMLRELNEHLEAILSAEAESGDSDAIRRPAHAESATNGRRPVEWPPRAARRAGVS